MQHLNVPQINRRAINNSLTEFSNYMDSLPKHPIAEVSWSAYPYRPKVDFAIAHAGDCILLKYYVEEAHLRCVNTRINNPVYEDSCVEFFIAFDDAGYYNLEFNCIGTALAGYGKCKMNRTLLEPAHIQQIEYEAKLRGYGKDRHRWELMLQIPVPFFQYHSIDNLSGLQCKANFYKCGDLTPKPHFLAWNRLNAPEPNFHLPSFFGTLVFE